MKRFFTFLKTELKLSLRDMNMPIFAVMMPLVIFIILGIIYGARPAYDGADYTFLEQSFGAVSAVAICAGGLMGLKARWRSSMTCCFWTCCRRWTALPSAAPCARKRISPS